VPEKTLTALLAARRRLPEIATLKGELTVPPMPARAVVAAATSKQLPAASAAERKPPSTPKYDDALHVVLAGHCSESDKSFVALWRRNSRTGKFHFQRVAETAPDHIRIATTADYSLAELAIANARCLWCASPLVRQGCRYAAPLVCRRGPSLFDRIDQALSCPGHCNSV